MLRSRILETPDVTASDSFEAVLDPDSRRLTVSATINTLYGQTSFQEGLDAYQ